MLFFQYVFITLSFPLEGDLYVAIFSNVFSFILSCRPREKMRALEPYLARFQFTQNWNETLQLEKEVR